MKAVLIVAHGSREAETKDTMEAITRMAAARLPETLIETAYMEFCHLNIAEGLDSLVAKGADDIRVVPYFLFSGIHIREDIPEELEKYRKNHPQIQLSMGRTLGADERLAEILSDRVREAL